jgi:hypothetical protein
MSARAIISGALSKAPQTKISRAGKPYAVATIREGTGERVRWWQAIAFSEIAIEALKEMAVGDPIAAAGEIDAEIYAPAGSDSRISWRITVDAVLSARAKPKKSKPQDGRQPFEGGPNDDVPF